MRKFRVLLVDDQARYYDQLAPLEDEFAGLEIQHATDQDSALDAIEAGFFHLAIVDVSLRGQARTDTDGLFVLDRIAETRPTCERVLFTTSVGGDDRRQALKAVQPRIGNRRVQASGYINKADPELRAPDLIRDRAERWLHHPVAVEGLDRVLHQLIERDVKGRELSPQRGGVCPNIDELDHVLSALFGQGLADPMRRVDMVSRIELHGMSEGWSRATTLWCEPRSENGAPGPRCVVKVGPRTDTEQEVERYRAYVRYQLRLRHRVELLDWCFGDTVGAVCYSHHDSATSEQRDLQALIADEDPGVFASISELFAPDDKQWLADESIEQDMARFFEREYARRMQKAAGKLRDTVSAQPDFAVEDDGSVARWGDVRLRLPTAVILGSPTMSGPFKGCIVHGDLHGGNILVTDEGHPVLIDYRNMARGPRLLDFASLEVSLRMTKPVCDRSAEELIGTDVPLEVAAWESAWGEVLPQEDPNGPYWQRLSSHIRCLARQNFPDATQVEYAATCLLRAIRVFVAKAPDDLQRRRLLLWISVLTSVIEEEESGF